MMWNKPLNPSAYFIMIKVSMALHFSLHYKTEKIICKEEEKNRRDTKAICKENE